MYKEQIRVTLGLMRMNKENWSPDMCTEEWVKIKRKKVSELQEYLKTAERKYQSIEEEVKFMKFMKYWNI